MEARHCLVLWVQRGIVLVVFGGLVGCQHLHFLGLHLIEEHERHQRMSKEELAREKEIKRLQREGIDGILPIYAIRFAQHEDRVASMFEASADPDFPRPPAPDSTDDPGVKGHFGFTMEKVEWTLNGLEGLLVERDDLRERIDAFRAYLSALYQETDWSAPPATHRRIATEVRRQFDGFIAWIESLTVDDLKAKHREDRQEEEARDRTR